jgi:CRP/FNR family transcriptional regulator
MTENLFIKKDELLFKQGDPSVCMYVINSGQFKIFITEEGEEIEVALAGAGNLIGEMSLFDKKSRSASARATMTSSVLKLPYKQLEKDLEAAPNWIRITLKALSTKLREANRRLLSY